MAMEKHSIIRKLLTGIFSLLCLFNLTAYAANSSTCSTTGEQKIAVVLVSFPSQPLLSEVTAASLRQIYFGPGPSVDGFLREVSYGKTWATGQVVGPVVLDADYFGQPEAARDAAIRAASSLIDFRNYTRLALVVPQASAGMESGGLGSIGCSTVALYPSGSTTMSTTWLGDASMGSPDDALAAATHEMGHNLGLEHARGADYGSDAVGPLGQAPAAFDGLREYADNFDNMGRGPGHWSAPHKSLLGWLATGSDVLNIETNGSFNLQPLENPAGGLKAIRVRRGTGNNAWLWIEYRQPVGFDAMWQMPQSAFTGAMIHYEDPAWNNDLTYSYLVRFNPDSAANGLFFGAAPLAAGTSWTDPYSNLTISIGQETSTALSVSISYAPPPACAVTLTPSNPSFTSNAGTGTISVTAPGGCSWTAAPSDAWITITSGSSGTGNGQIGYSVAATTTTAARWARIAVGSAVAVVTQAGLAGSATISPSSASFPAAGGNGIISVATNAQDYAWSFTSNADWITGVFSSKFDTVGSETVRYIISQNTGSAARTGTISIAGWTFTITQTAGGSMLSQLVWQEATTPDAPISRLCLAMAPFPTRGQAVLYGGNADGTTFSDTWVWNGSTWTQVHPAHNPGPLCAHAMAYDAAHDQVVLFGGWDQSGNWLNGTWIWDGNDWRQLHPATNPPGRAYTSMLYNPISGKVFMFGGNGYTSDWNQIDDTWEWDGTNWTQLPTPTAPSPRYGHAMTYDAARNEIVLFGGMLDTTNPSLSPSTFYSDTWAWDGTRWKQKTTAVSPAARWAHQMGYDPNLKQVVMIGGQGAKDISVSPPFTWDIDMHEETWTWDGTSWQQRFPNKSPEFSYAYGMIYDATLKTLVVHLGDDLHCATRGPKTYLLQIGPTADAFSIPSSGGTTLASSGPATLSSGYASIQPGAGSTAPEGFAIVDLRQNGALISEAAVPASPAIQSGRIYAEIGGSVDTGLAIVNPNSQDASLSFYFTDVNGHIFGNGAATIPANGKIVGFLDQAPFNGGSPVSGTFTFNSSVPVAAVALRGLTNERSEFLIATLPVTDLGGSIGTGPIVIPDYVSGAGWTTQIVLVNPGSSAQTGSVQLRDPSGASAPAFSYSIQPRAAQVLPITGLANTVATGSVLIAPDPGTGTPSAMTLLSYSDGQATVDTTSVPAQPAGNAFRLYAETLGVLGQAGSIQTGIAVVNTSANTATVSVTVTALDGTPTGLTGTLSIPANGQISMFLTQIPGLGALPASFQGTLRLSSNAFITVIGLRVRFNERGESLFAMTPALNEASAPSIAPLYFPHIVDSGGFSTEFVLFDGSPGQSASGTLELYSGAGEPLSWTMQ